MTNRLAIRTILAAACILCAAAAFPQVLTKSPKVAAKRKRTNSLPRPATSDVVSKTYVVKQGDTLYGIAGAHGTTVAALKSANQLHTTQLKVGQKLTLPGPSHKAAKAAQTTAKTVPKRALATAVAGPPKAAAPAIEADDSAPEDVVAGVPAGIVLVPKDANANGDEPAVQPLRYRLASMGLGFLGVRYRRNGQSERSGFDCSGLVKTLFEKFRITMPRSSREQFKVGEKVYWSDLEVGDLVFFSSRGKTPTHVGIYIGENQFLHAALKAKRVLVSNLTSSWYMKRFLGGRRFLDLWKDEPKAAETKSAETKSN